jgi:hypothetical protein
VTGTRVVPIREEAIMATPAKTQGVIRSLIPARIDGLPWSPPDSATADMARCGNTP